MRKLFGGVRSEVDEKLGELDAILAALRLTISDAKLEQKDFVPHHQMLLAVFAELECTIKGLASGAAVHWSGDRLKGR